MESVETAAAFVTRWTAEIRELQEKLRASTVVSTISDRANTLTAELTEWSDRLPPYELRRCTELSKELGQAIAQARAETAPKPKFSLKSRRPRAAPPSNPPLLANATLPSPIISSNTQNTDRQLPPPPANSVHLTASTPSYLTSRDLPPPAQSDAGVSQDQPLVMTVLSDCLVDLLPSSSSSISPDSPPYRQTSALYLYGLKRCIILLPPVAGSIIAHDCYQCLFVMGGHQFRMHNSTKCRIYLHTGSIPIIEGCRDLTFALYPQHLLPPNTASIPLETVQDFDFPFATPGNPSPNYRVGDKELDLSAWGDRAERWKELLVESIS